MAETKSKRVRERIATRPELAMLHDAARILGINGLADACEVGYFTVQSWLQGRARVPVWAVPLIVHACRKVTGLPVVTFTGLRPDAANVFATTLLYARTNLRVFVGEVPRLRCNAPTAPERAQRPDESANEEDTASAAA